MAQRRTLHDHYFKQAKAEGYLARSAYKLIEINERRRVLRSGDAVLDLGCSPGAWMQVSLQAVGGRGRVVGVDLKPVRHEFGPCAQTITGDVFDLDAKALLTALDDAGARLYDVVLSDMAPNTSGDVSDHFRSVRLCDRALELSSTALRRGGRLVMKALEGEAYPDLLQRTRDAFENVRGFKPKSSRSISREMYIVAIGLRKQPARDAMSD